MSEIGYPFSGRSGLLIVAGIGFLIVGIVVIILGNIDSQNAKNESIIPPTRVIVWGAENWNTLNDNSYVDVKTAFNFTTSDDFAIYNPIHYNITSTVTGKDRVKQIYWIFDNGNYSIKNTLGNNTASYLQLMQKRNFLENNMFNLTRINNTNIFQKTDSWNSTEERNIPLFAIIIYDNGQSLITENSPIILTIRSSLNVLQAQTDRDLIKQTHESALTNAEVLGLTLVIIGLIPIGFAIEFWIEYSVGRHFYQLEKSERELKKPEEKSNSVEKDPNKYHNG